MKQKILTLITCAMICLMTVSSFLSNSPIAYAQAPFTKVATLDLYQADNDARCSVISGDYLYVGTEENPTKIIKISLTTFTVTSRLTLLSGETNIADMVVSGDFLYAGLDLYPIAKIVKINLTSFTRLGALTFNSGEEGIGDQLIIGSYLYAQCHTYPCKIVKVNLTSFTRDAVLTLNTGENSACQLSTDGTYIYATTYNYIVKIAISSFSRITALSLSSLYGEEFYGKEMNYVNEISYPYLYITCTLSWMVGWIYYHALHLVRVKLNTFSWNATLELENQYLCCYDGFISGSYLYVGRDGYYDSFYKISLDSFTVVDQTCVGNPETYYNYQTNGFSISGDYLYSPKDSRPATIYKFKLSTFSTVSILTLYTGVSADYVAAMVNDGTYLYAVMDMSPAKASKVRLSDFTLETTLAFNSGENYALCAILNDGFLYVGLETGYPAKIVKVNCSSMTRISVLNIADTYAVRCIAISGNYLYAGIENYLYGGGAIFEVSLSTFSVTRSLILASDEEPTDFVVDGNYLYVALDSSYYSSITIVNLISFERGNTGGMNPSNTAPMTMCLDSELNFLYITGQSYPTVISKASQGTLKEIDTLTLPYALGYGAYDSVIAYGYLYLGLDYADEGGVVTKISLGTFSKIASLALNRSNNEKTVRALSLDGEYLYAGIDVNAPAKIVKIYLGEIPSPLNVVVSSSPEIHAKFYFDEAEKTTPTSFSSYIDTHEFTAVSKVTLNFRTYNFNYWLVNGTTKYAFLSILLTLNGDANLQIVYTESPVTPPPPYGYVRGALNATWYMRSDTHTIHETLGYKLLTVNTQTPAFDKKTESGTHNVSYGVRVWAIDFLDHFYELTSGSPVATVTKSDIGGEMLVAYWNCPAYGSMIDSIMVRVYWKFDDTNWSPLPPFITGKDLLIRLPKTTWTFHYYVNRTVGSTNSTFGFGSYTIYNSRVDLQYYKASPWDVALARLWQRDFIKFMFTPWTYWLGDLFWTVVLFGCIVMAYLRTGSLKPILGLLWILGGSGSILWYLIPATALHIAVLMLAMAMAITYFRLVYK